MCDAILEVLHPEFIKFPTSEEEWFATSREYEFAWNFTHCVAAIDGKHVIMQAPPRNSGLSFYNYKHTHSIVLLAICDAYYHFIMVDVRDAGRHSGGDVLANSSFGKALHNNTLSLPPS